MQSNTITRRSIFKLDKIWWKMEKFKCDISNDFQTIFSGQKFIKNAKNGSFRRVFFQNLKLAVKQGYQTGHFK